MFGFCTILALGAVFILGFADAYYYHQRTADDTFLLRQKKLLKLTWHPSQSAIVNPELHDEGLSYDIRANIESYSNKEAVYDFLDKWEKGMMRRGAIFTPYYPELLEECTALFRLFYYANDFDTFYKTAAWARVHVNEGQYMYALYSAVFRRPDTFHMQLPPHYEMYPYAYYNYDAITKAINARLTGRLEVKNQSVGYDTYIIPANYSSWYQVDDYDLEHKLNYLTEDIEWNYYYFLYRQEMPFWLRSEEFGFPEYRGEEYLYGHKLIMNRYYLERLSNNIPLLEDFDWHREFPVGYYPTMVYHNGFPYPQRPAKAHFPDHKYKYITDIEDFESRVAAAIDSGFLLAPNGTKIDIYTREGLNMLGNVIEGNADSIHPRYYGSIDSHARKILGFNLEPSEPHNILPSALESFSTSMRDPAFYRLYKRIVDYYNKYKAHQGPYLEEEIVFPEMEIKSCTVDDLITYYDEYDSVISNGLAVESQREADTHFVKIRQHRLNHKHFNINLTIHSDNPTKAAIKIFLGPKYDTHHREMEFQESYKYFYEMDQTIVDLKAGLNHITHYCHNSLFVSTDSTTGEELYMKLKRALNGTEEFSYKESIFGFPDRLLLPRGRKEGMPFQLFVYVNPIESKFTRYNARIWGQYDVDDKPFGFPLDRPPKYRGSNMLFKNVMIYHQENVHVVF